MDILMAYNHVLFNIREAQHYAKCNNPELCEVRDVIVELQHDSKQFENQVEKVIKLYGATKKLTEHLAWARAVRTAAESANANSSDVKSELDKMIKCPIFNN